MDSRRCEYCGSNNLVWDQSRGIVVCGECGTVLENIYDFRPPFIEPVVSKRVTRVGRIIKDPTFLREFYVFFKQN
ncbi:TFIIB-type zinc ribbon-containing protein [Metallosphaera hakonensis]|uniref:TFIIB-type zinc ribbon-containing protein n=1 Tax=Metallosphaera hakonensis TaxID=79601 RepID=UPI000B2CCAB9